MKLLTLDEFWKGKRPATGKAGKCDKCDREVTEYLRENEWSIYCPDCAVEVYEDYVDARTNGGL